MANNDKFDQLMTDLTSGKLKDKWDEIMNRVEAVLKQEKMGTLNEMMHDIKSFLEKHNKVKDYLNKDGDFTPPFELVFSWFNKTVTEHRKNHQAK